jgi:hypothetical protein
MTYANGRPLRHLPSRLSASTIIETLGQIGIEIPLAISASAKSSREEMGFSIKAMRFRLDEKALDAALARQDLTISDRLRLKFALEDVGLLYR